MRNNAADDGPKGRREALTTDLWVFEEFKLGW